MKPMWEEMPDLYGLRRSARSKHCLEVSSRGSHNDKLPKRQRIKDMISMWEEMPDLYGLRRSARSRAEPESYNVNSKSDSQNSSNSPGQQNVDRNGKHCLEVSSRGSHDDKLPKRQRIEDIKSMWEEMPDLYGLRRSARSRAEPESSKVNSKSDSQNSSNTPGQQNVDSNDQHCVEVSSSGFHNDKRPERRNVKDIKSMWEEMPDLYGLRRSARSRAEPESNKVNNKSVSDSNEHILVRQSNEPILSSSYSSNTPDKQSTDSNDEPILLVQSNEPILSSSYSSNTPDEQSTDSNDEPILLVQSNEPILSRSYSSNTPDKQSADSNDEPILLVQSNEPILSSSYSSNTPDKQSTDSNDEPILLVQSNEPILSSSYSSNTPDKQSADSNDEPILFVQSNEPILLYTFM
ncbi:unnamed protein product [Owenia fusiformis]|uniref:Uncharacterized protein n=1 Tax=Owenia fusiformis TaxID=6347 RepID=A0A8J1UWC6_OWEFU|nr:unnamed protein product [Owenia fusiformis]